MKLSRLLFALLIIAAPAAAAPTLVSVKPQYLPPAELERVLGVQESGGRGIIEWRAAAGTHEQWVNLASDFQQLGLVCQDIQTRRMWVRQIQNLNLRYHQRLGHRTGKSAAFARQSSRITCAGHNRRLFNRHRNQDIPPVNQEIGSNSQWKPQCAHCVFDHVVGGGG